MTHMQWTTKFTGIGDLTLGTVTTQQCQSDEVLVSVQTVSLNYRDLEVIKGEYRHHQNVDFSSAVVPCSDMCALVHAVGDDAKTQFAVGDRVMAIYNQTHLTGQILPHHVATGLGLPLEGVLQQFRVFPATSLVKVPDYLTNEQAACLPIAGVTAWMALNGMNPIGHPLGQMAPANGTIVLIQGTGGVSISGLQIAKAAGAKGR
jgi:NADPH:quinone reductase-like Zn-dependent oxidoreductase